MTTICNWAIVVSQVFLLLLWYCLWYFHELETMPSFRKTIPFWIQKPTSTVETQKYPRVRRLQFCEIGIADAFCKNAASTSSIVLKTKKIIFQSIIKRMHCIFSTIRRVMWQRWYIAVHAACVVRYFSFLRLVLDFKKMLGYDYAMCRNWKSRNIKSNIYTSLKCKRSNTVFFKWPVFQIRILGSGFRVL